MIPQCFWLRLCTVTLVRRSREIAGRFSSVWRWYSSWRAISQRRSDRERCCPSKISQQSCPSWFANFHGLSDSASKITPSQCPFSFVVNAAWFMSWTSLWTRSRSQTYGLWNGGIWKQFPSFGKRRVDGVISWILILMKLTRWRRSSYLVIFLFVFSRMKSISP